MNKIISLIAAGLIAVALAATAAPTPPVFQVRLVADNPSTHSEPMELVRHSPEGTATNVLNIDTTVLLDRRVLKSAFLERDHLGYPAISLVFTDVGAKQLADVTRQNMGQRVAIIIYGHLYEAPYINAEISSGGVEVSARFTLQEATDLVRKINESVAGK